MTCAPSWIINSLASPSIQGSIRGTQIGYRDEAQADAKAMQAAGAKRIGRVYRGQIHDFFLMTGRLDAAHTLIADAASALRTML